MNDRMEKKSGFSLIEIIVYIAIFSVSSVFLVNILTTVTRTHVRQLSVNEVDSQLSFVAGVIERAVRGASLVENAAGIPSSTLVLRMASSTSDPTKIYVDASSSAVYLKEGAVSPVALTDDKMKVSGFSVTKYENPGGLAVVQVDLTLDYSSNMFGAKASRTWRSAIARVSAATFDSSILPNADASLDIGNAGVKWKDGYFSGNVNVSGRLGLGTSYSPSAQLKSAGDLSIATSSAGLILTAPNGACYRLTVNNSGQVVLTSVSCP